MGKWHHIVPCHMKLSINYYLLFKLKHFVNIVQVTLEHLYVITRG